MTKFWNRKVGQPFQMSTKISGHISQLFEYGIDSEQNFNT